MNREILFKAKRKDNGEWVEGQYAYTTNPLTEDGKPIKHLICNGTNIFNDLIDPILSANTQDLPTRTGRRFGRMILLNVINEKKNADYIKSFGEKSMLILGLCL